MRVVVDADGGDHAPQVVIDGVLRYKRDCEDVELCLVGGSEAEAVFRERKGADDKIDFRRSETPISMDEHPATAIKSKPGSSIVVCARMVRDGEADAAFSAGNTGAWMASALLNVGRLKGISRPALPTPIPNRKGGQTILLDAGANSDCKPFQLVQFALMGSIYARLLFGVDNPKVGLLNIGAESSKGNELAVETYKLMHEKTDNFIGNVEGNEVFSGEVDVVVCDGFVGNVFLKTAEGTIKFFVDSLREEIGRRTLAKVGGALMRSVFSALRRRTDYQEYGGSPLLGLAGVCVVGHGASGPLAVYNAVRLAGNCFKMGLSKKVEEELKGKEQNG